MPCFTIYASSMGSTSTMHTSCRMVRKAVRKLTLAALSISGKHTGMSSAVMKLEMKV